MNLHVEFFLAVAACVAALNYAWWVKVRVWLLREDLFVIRDQLWDKMLELGRLEDAEHVKAREGMNALIRVAPALSVFTIFHVIHEDTEAASRSPSVVDPYVDAAINRVAKYVFRQTLTGIVIGLPWMLIHWKHSIQQKLSGALRKFFESAELQAVSWKVNQGHRRPSVNVGL